MFSPVCKTLLRRSHSFAATQPLNTVAIFQNKPFAFSLRRIAAASNHHSFTTSYLINKCGLTPESASSASKYVNFKDPRNPDSVLAFLRKNGLSEPQISTLIRKRPPFLLSDPEKTLLPKVEFLHSRGMSSAQIATTLCKHPQILLRSLKHIIHVFDFLSNMLQSDVTTISMFNRFCHIITKDVDAYLLRNITTLREIGVPEPNILTILKSKPRIFGTGPTKFKETVAEIKNMGFNPSEFRFVSAVFVAIALNKSTVESKFRAFGKWGWSEEDCLEAFRRFPPYLMSSEDKIMRVMDFLVNRMGYQSLSIARRPNVVALSMEKRFAPRGLVIENLRSKGLVKEVSLQSFEITEQLFLERFVYRFEKESSELLKLYEKTN